MWGGFGGGWDNQVSSYTVYTSDLNLSIDRAATGERLFEGRAQAQSRDSDLTAIVPNLVQAMFTGFPGNSGERVRITDRKSGVEGKGVSVRVDLGGSRLIQKKKSKKT